MIEIDDPDKMIFIGIVIFSVLFIAKIVFWISLGTLIFGATLYAMRADRRKTALMIISYSLLIIPVSYFIGYVFDQSALGQSLIDAANYLAQLDQNTNQILGQS